MSTMFAPTLCYRFSIDLQTGRPALDADVALHFNPRLDENLAVLNSRRSGVWADEERQPMCIMQDDGKAMQAFRPGHSTQVPYCDMPY